MDDAKSTRFRIGQLATLAGTSVPTIRFYEAQGLLDEPVRGASGQRTYGEADLATLQFIRRAREFDFPLPTIRRLLDLRGDVGCTCNGLLDFGKQQLETLRSKLAELSALEAELSQVVESCESTCVGGPVADCTISVRLHAPGTGRGGRSPS